jgi:uncharacterized repeat protein (TIGR03803 family)
MSRRQLLAALGKALLTIAVSLMLANHATAQSKFKVLYSFSAGADGGGVWERVALDTLGNLYGTTSGGGAYGYGTVFELTPTSHGPWKESVLHSFMLNDVDGAEPMANLILDSVGNLYGTAPLGGAYDRGSAFQLSPGSGGWTLSVLYSFCTLSGCSDGSAPKAGLVMDKAGNLYGTAFGAFELAPGSGGWTESVIYPFCLDPNCNPQNGSDPAGGLIFDTAGNLYGATTYGGDLSCGNGNGCGTVYELTLSGGTWNETVLYSFGSIVNDGQLPGIEQLAMDTSGNLYGTTGQGGTHICFGTVGCGTVFKLTKGSNGTWKETVLHNFSGGADGGSPVGGLLIKGGALYGATAFGGSPNCGCGVVYKLSPGSGGRWTTTILHTFLGSDGAQHTDGLISDNKGRLYGTTVTGGKGGAGEVYELIP